MAAVVCYKEGKVCISLWLVMHPESSILTRVLRMWFAKLGSLNYFKYFGKLLMKHGLHPASEGSISSKILDGENYLDATAIV
jgi:hypothetical protein